MELDALSKEIMPSLDGGQVVHMVSEQMMLSELARNLHLVVERQLEILDLAENHQGKFTEQCSEVERFLEETESILSEVSLPYDASDYRIVSERLEMAKGLTGRFVEMNSQFQELGHSGYRLPLMTAESSRLKGISDRWHRLHSGSKALEKKFQQQSLLLQSFSDKCEEWNKFLADEENVLSVDLVGDYVSLANQQQLLEVNCQ